MIPLLASFQVLSVGVGIVGVLLAFGQVQETEAVSRSLRDCVTRRELKGDPVCAALASTLGQHQRSAGVVLAGVVASAAGAAVAVASRRPPG